MAICRVKAVGWWKSGEPRGREKSELGSVLVTWMPLNRAWLRQFGARLYLFIGLCNALSFLNDHQGVSFAIAKVLSAELGILL